MELFEYQIKAMNTCMDSSRNISYMALGLAGEVGELTSKLAKGIRKGQVFIGSELHGNYAFPSDSDMHYSVELLADPEKKKALEDGLKGEVGDCLWFVAGLCEVMGWSLEDIARENIDKLASRQKRGVIEGNGDNR